MQTRLPVLFLVFTWVLSSMAAEEGMIVLDPICETISSQTPPLPPGNPAPGTLRMARRLAEFREKAPPDAMAYMSDRVAGFLAGRLTNTSRVDERFRIQFALAVQQVNSGRPDSALNTFSPWNDCSRRVAPNWMTGTRSELRLRKAVAFLPPRRTGELPRDPQRRFLRVPHSSPRRTICCRGSGARLPCLEPIWRNIPADLSTRWLLNLAHDPRGVPDR